MVDDPQALKKQTNKNYRRVFLEVMKEHYWSLCNKYLAKTTRTQTYMPVQRHLKRMSDLFFCCFQKIFFVFCRIFIGLLCKVVHLTKKINGKIMKDYTRLTPFAHKNTLRKRLHFSLIRVSIENFERNLCE